MVKLISGPDVYLRHPIKSDAKYYEMWLTDMSISMPLGDEVYSIITLSDMEKQIEEYGNSDFYMFSIVTNEDDRVIGRCVLFGIDRVNSNGMVGIFIGDKKYWGRGYAKQAFEMLLEYSFRIQNLHSIMLGVFEFNTRAIRLYESIGFKKIGVKRDTRKINGKYVNAVLMDMLESEYENKYIDFSIID